MVEFRGDEVCLDPFHENGVVVKVTTTGVFSLEQFR